ncbi:MAG: AlpA family phage regulatory protein [Roseomonas sp.]|nr:AlpA family phage regulatory protein [Roseomonas sp.]
MKLGEIIDGDCEMNVFQILSVAEAAKILGVSKATLRRVMRADATFPRPLRIGARRIGWRGDELSNWLSMRPRK